MKIAEEMKNYQEERKKEIRRKYMEIEVAPKEKIDRSSLDALAESGRLKNIALYWRMGRLERGEAGGICPGELFMARMIESKEGWNLVGKYEDYGCGKFDDENSSLERLIEDCEAGKVDLIVVNSFMSLTCSVDYTIMLVQRLRALEHPVYVKFEKDNLCTYLPEHDLLFDILLATEEEMTRTRMHKSLLAKSMLQEILQNGPVEYEQIVRSFSKKKVSMCTVKKVRKEMGVISYRHGGKQYWSLFGKPKK